MRRIDELNDQLEEERKQRIAAVERYAIKGEELKKAQKENENLKKQVNDTIASLNTKIVEANETLSTNFKNVRVQNFAHIYFKPLL